MLKMKLRRDVFGEYDYSLGKMKIDKKILGIEKFKMEWG